MSNIDFATANGWKSVADKYLELPLVGDKVQVMYVWIDGIRNNVRAKTRTLQKEPKSVKGAHHNYCQMQFKKLTFRCAYLEHEFGRLLFDSKF